MRLLLSDGQILKLTSAVVLGSTWRHVLSDFEVELVRELGKRFVAFGRASVITDAEWRVLDDAIAAMRKARDGRVEGQPLAAAGALA